MPTEEARRISVAFLEQLMRLEGELLSASDKHQKTQILGDLRRIRQDFAKHLTPSDGKDLRHLFHHNGFLVRPCWRVASNPRKLHKQAAIQWMEARGIQWDGSAPCLRREVLRALDRGEPIPPGQFGLFVEWTVRIELLTLELIN